MWGIIKHKIQQASTWTICLPTHISNSCPNFHQPSMNLTKYYKGVYSFGIKVFNMLSSYIKIESDNPKKFKLILQIFLYKIL